MLSTSRGLRATAQWFISQGVLQQFQTAHEIQQEDTRGYTPFQPLRDWTPPPNKRKYMGKPEPLLNPLTTP